ncbi:hypothetical protein GE061_010775 [Apolygus lucorum]|uniref:Uncharacterized protein n=1 Tax=Apolygus lucorum TaxID=248454 RepID=A0A6A4K2F9_APOLU|nr:hypothetical protein GE061_010775 [Apolygus lucorum]
MSTVFSLALVLTSVGYAAGQCPSNAPGSLQYMFYPSITQDFTLCSTYSSSSATYSCPEGFVFKPRTSYYDFSPLCTFRRAGRYTFDCSQNGNGSYSGDVTLYATCESGKATAVNECPKGTQFMTNNRRCEMVCSKIGIFGVSQQDYYTCTYDYMKYEFTMKNETCSQNTQFMDGFQFCFDLVTIEEVSNLLISQFRIPFEQY